MCRTLFIKRKDALLSYGFQAIVLSLPEALVFIIYDGSIDREDGQRMVERAAAFKIQTKLWQRSLIQKMQMGCAVYIEEDRYTGDKYYKI